MQLYNALTAILSGENHPRLLCRQRVKLPLAVTIIGNEDRIVVTGGVVAEVGQGRGGHGRTSPEGPLLARDVGGGRQGVVPRSTGTISSYVTVIYHRERVGVGGLWKSDGLSCLNR